MKLVYFKNLDFIVKKGVDPYIEVRAMIDGIDDNDSQQTAISGTVISVTLDLDNTNTNIKGSNSGTAITLADVPATKIFTILNNKLIATEVALSNTTLTIGTKELIKFTLDVQGDNEAYLQTITPVINKSEVTIATSSLVLKEGGNTIATSEAGGVLTITGSDVIKTGKTYIIEGVITAVTADASISTKITVNSGTDGISWDDYGTNGTDGSVSTWIDLGDSSVSRISGSLSN